MRLSHEERIKAISAKLNQPSENLFDMRKLEQELFAIQRGGTVGDPSAPVPSLEDEEDEDDVDPFNRFWGVVEPLVNKLSQTPSPPSTSPRQPPVMSDTAFDEAETDRIQQEMSLIDDSFFTCPTKAHQNLKNYTQSDQNPVTLMLNPDDNPEEENKTLKAQIADIKNEIRSLQQVNIHAIATVCMPTY